MEPKRSSQKKRALLCLMLSWFYHYSITAAVCGMVVDKEIRSTFQDRLLKQAAGIIAAGGKHTDADIQRTH